jgi:hypothetical protein
MGRRRVERTNGGKSLLTEELLLRALAHYSRPISLEKIKRQMRKLEPRLMLDYEIDRLDDVVGVLLDGLVYNGDIHFDLKGRGPFNIGAPRYWLRPLERLALV